jgi:hypothetical protein
MTKPIDPTSTATTNFFQEYWLRVRPYLLRIAVDFTVSIGMYVGLFAFKCVVAVLKVDDWAGTVFVTLHSVGAIIAVALFIWYAAVDIVDEHRK